MSMLEKIIVKGGREHNLQNITVEIPKNKLIVITGISGSGKSSLAFDTIYAEGQRRYVESLSSYARQFLGIMDKPDVDQIEGLSPSISIDQKTTSHNPRSTVGTVTEIYDYLRLLFARVGHPYCPVCHIEIVRLSVDEMVDRVFELIRRKINVNRIKPYGFVFLSPVVRDRKGEFKSLFDNLKAKGYSKIRIDKKEIDLSLSKPVNLIKTNKHNIEVVVDRISVGYRDFKDKIFRANLRSRLVSDIEQAISLSDGLVLVCSDDGEERLFSERFSCPSCNLSLPELEPRMFSFNSPLGACPKCKGIGTIFKIDKEAILNKNLTINEGGILPFSNIYYQDTWYLRLIKTAAREEGVDFDTVIREIPKEKLERLLYGTGKVYRVKGTNRFGKETVIFERFNGIIPDLERRYFESRSGSIDHKVGKYMREETCDQCKGDRLKPEVLSVVVGEYNIAQITRLSINKLHLYLEKDLSSQLSDFEKKIAFPILREIKTRLRFLRNVGLGYLTLNRKAKTLSGGEGQRIRLASQIGTGLTGVLYVLDEPSIGLHPRDLSALIQSLKELRDLGNTLIVVEHDRETMESADFLIELGPKAGKDGGKIVFSGSLEEMKKDNKSLTGLYLSGKKVIDLKKRDLVKSRGNLRLLGACQYNLKKIDVEFPLGNLIGVTGVSGSGKSTLISETLYPALRYYLNGYYQGRMGKFDRLEGYHYLKGVYLVDQSPIGRTPRSNVATYTGFFDEIREVFSQTVEAKSRGFSPGRFSFNLKGGRCEKCSGGGLLKIEMQFLSDVYVTCDVCGGKRYNQETLEVRYKGKTIAQVLAMTVDEAADFFRNHQRIFRKLRFLQEVGLGYIQLGQPAPTFSGGEAQRIKLANELSKKETGKNIYILDEPTTGLHFHDIEKLLNTLINLVDRGNTVVVIEHNLDVIINCQYIIDLGPEGGDKGGQVVYQGETKGILSVKNSHTGRYLANHLRIKELQ